MKRLLSLITILCCISFTASAQCNIANYPAAFKIPPASFPYTNGANITVNAALVNVNPLTNFTYNCNNVPYTCSNPAWWINNSNASIVLTFSQPVCNFTVVVNGTGNGEEFYFTPNNGTISCSNICPQSFAYTNGGTSVLCTAGNALGSIITVDNPTGATQYTLTHNGLASGSRMTLLDCYVGCGSVSPGITCTVPNPGYCAGDTTTINYSAVGTFNAGNSFTVQLSDALGSFAMPTIIGSVSSTATSGGILCTIPAATPTGAGYRLRVVSSNQALTGSDNGTNITINQFPMVMASAVPNDTLCQGDSLTLIGAGATTYSWSAPAVNNIPFVPAGTATYLVTGSDAIGCTNTATIEVVVNPNPIITITVSPDDSICENESVTLTASGAANINWTSGVLNGVPFIPTGSAIYTATGTDANGCSNTASQAVTVKPLPIVNLGPNVQICDGDSLVLNAGLPGATYVWQDNSTAPTFIVKQTGTYTVAVTRDGCTATDNISVLVNPNPVIDLGPDVWYCEGESITIGDNCPSCTYLWSTNETSSMINVNQEGNYIVTATANNCTSSDEIFVDEIPLPLVDLGPDTTFCFGDEILLDVTRAGGTYLWQDNTTTPTYVIRDIGTYEVIVTENGCDNSDDKIVTYDDDCECPVNLPNAFTPNGDTRNDVFRLMNPIFIELEYFKIYNRWGQEVFTTTDPTSSWDGKLNGVECEIGAYYWVVGYKCLYKNTDHQLRGDVTLIR
jgi:gliding motility-associated-like protein